MTTNWLKLIASFTSLAFLTSCATQPVGQPQDVAAAKLLREARSPQLSPESRAIDCLDAAAITAPELGSGKQPTLARKTYNAACAELTILLRSADGGHLWNDSITLAGKDKTYHLQLQPARYGVWAPDYFTSFEKADTIQGKQIREGNEQDGVGGALVGIRSLSPREAFAPMKGITAPVTATLDFHGTDASLALHRPAKQPSALVAGNLRPLEADFSAPLSYYRPPASTLLVGLMAALRAGKYTDKTGLYFLQPYDPNRIPAVFVHGLLSTPFSWVKTINAIQADPLLRGRYQFWVFAYPTGNPILYSALRLREELAKADKLYPNHRPYVLVGHSMGGILSHLQVTTLTRAMWEKELGSLAKGIFARNSSDSLIVRATTFQANPRVKRVVFICTPHRGSAMASGAIGRFAISLITLPLSIATNLKDVMTHAELVQITGSAKRLPNSVSGLSPTNPAFKVVNNRSITVPYHSIIGDRGKRDTPNSTDGVVPYWSSHLDGAQSELIVPGPHSSCELPQTVAELNRIFTLHLKSD